LKAYKKAQLTSSSSTNTSSTNSTAKARPLAETSSPSSGSCGGDSVVHNLLDAMIHPDDVFITAANLLSAMGDGYIDSVNDQIDKVLEKANMTDTIAVNFAEYIGEDAAISSLELRLEVKNTLPFNITLGADFINDDDNGNEAIIKDTTVNGAENTPPTSPFTAKFTTDRKSQLDNIKNATGVRFSVICRKDKEITEQDLRTLSKRTIAFSLRVRIQAPMNKLGF
jgi:hypothetical protein